VWSGLLFDRISPRVFFFFFLIRQIQSFIFIFSDEMGHWKYNPSYHSMLMADRMSV